MFSKAEKDNPTICASRVCKPVFPNQSKKLPVVRSSLTSSSISCGSLDEVILMRNSGRSKNGFPLQPIGRYASIKKVALHRIGPGIIQNIDKGSEFQFSKYFPQSLFIPFTGF